MIKGMHAMFYSSEAEVLRAFLRDKLGLRGTDVGDGWLIFDPPEADLGVHPTSGAKPPSGTAEVSFYCDSIEQTVAVLKARGGGKELRHADAPCPSGPLPSGMGRAGLRQEGDRER